MYKNYDILTFGSYASDVLFKVSPSININKSDLENFENKIIKTLAIGPINLVSEFIKYKVLKNDFRFLY